MEPKHIRFREFIFLFFLGGTLYPVLEILFRGYTHFSMALLGGICAVALKTVDTLLGNVRIVWKAAVCAVIITQLELICGLLVNCHLKMNVWDYSHLPMNLAGQICPIFSAIWFLLSFITLHLFRLQGQWRRYPTA